VDFYIGSMATADWRRVPRLILSWAALTAPALGRKGAVGGPASWQGGKPRHSEVPEARGGQFQPFRGEPESLEAGRGSAQSPQ
jgi:hypothetical protein